MVAKFVAGRANLTKKTLLHHEGGEPVFELAVRCIIPCVHVYFICINRVSSLTFQGQNGWILSSLGFEGLFSFISIRIRFRYTWWVGVDRSDSVLSDSRLCVHCAQGAKTITLG